MKKNCWEHMGCGRESGGARAVEFGVCPASTEARMDGIHGGTNAGRACWIVAGTLCTGQVRGTFAIKYDKCEDCKFYAAVKKEELSRFSKSIVLLNRIGAFA